MSTTSSTELTLQQLFPIINTTTEEQDQSSSSSLLLDNHQLAHVSQLVFREDSLDPKMRVRVYDFILSDGNNQNGDNNNIVVRNDDDDDSSSEGEDEEEEKNINEKKKRCPFKQTYSRHQNSVRGFNDDIFKLVSNTLANVASKSNKFIAENIIQEGDCFYIKELCGLCEYLASRLELTGSGAAGFVASTVIVMFLAVVEESTSSSSAENDDDENSKKKTNKKLPRQWPSTVFRLSFKFAEKHKYVLSLSTSAKIPNNSNTASSSNNNKNVALILLRLILQYHLPGIMRHCDQYQMPLCDWILDQWLLNQMMNLLFFVTSDDDKNSSSSLSLNKNLLAFFDFIIAARDPLIMFGLAVETLSISQEKLKSVVEKDKFKEAFFSSSSAVSSAFSAMSVDQQPRITMLHAQQLLRSTPRCAKNRLRHYFHGTKLLYPLPANNMNLNEQASSPSTKGGTAAATTSTAPVEQQVNFDERELYESQVVLPVSNTELVEAFAMSTTTNDDDGFTSVNSSKKISGNKNDSDFDHHLRPLSFVILDCRSERSFHFARLPTAIHIGADVGYDPELMVAMIERFEGARGSHMCVLGTGRGVPEEANLLKIIALRFVQAGFPFVSIAEEGFKGLIPMIKGGKVEVVKSQVQPTTTSAASPASSPQQQQQPQNNNNNTNTTSKSKTADELLKKAEETAKEAKETATRWGKSIMTKFSGWSLGGGGGGKSSSSSESTNNNNSKTNNNASPTPENASKPSAVAEGNQNGNNNSGKQSPPSTLVDDRQEQEQDQLPSNNNNNGGSNSETTFHAGGANDQDDDDDDELLSQLVTTVQSPPASASASSATATTTSTAKPAVTTTKEATTGDAAAGDANHHPFDELFGDD